MKLETLKPIGRITSRRVEDPFQFTSQSPSRPTFYEAQPNERSCSMKKKSPWDHCNTPGCETRGQAVISRLTVLGGKPICITCARRDCAENPERVAVYARS